MNRWWVYQKERFPLLAHGPLIAAFSACAVAFSSLLENAPAPGWQMFLTAFGVCLLMFLQLRIADEFKDAEEDARWRPYRPVPRGLVTLKELRLLFIITALIQTGLVLALDRWLLIVLAIAWSYLALMSVEFFCRDWLKKRPVIYLVTHMGIMPLVDFFWHRLRMASTWCSRAVRSGVVPRCEFLQWHRHRSRSQTPPIHRRGGRRGNLQPPLGKIRRHRGVDRRTRRYAGLRDYCRCGD